MKILPALPPTADPTRSAAFSALAEAAQPFASLLDGPADMRQADHAASFGFGELGLFGRGAPAAVAGPAAPSAGPARAAVAAPAVSAITPDGAPGALAPSAEPLSQTALALREATPVEPVHAPAVAPAEPISQPRMVIAQQLQGVLPEREAAPAVGAQRRLPPPERQAAAPVSVVILERDGVLEVVAGAAGLGAGDRQAILRAAKAEAERAGLTLGDILINGETAAPDTIESKGDQDGRQFG